MISEFSNFKPVLDSLTPSELFFIYKTKESSATELLKFSLQHLYLQSCIGFQAVFHKNEKDGEEYYYHVITKSEKSSNQQIKPHEQFVLEKLNNEKDKIPLAFIKKMIFPTLTDHKKFYYNYFYLTLVEKGLFKRTLLLEKMDVFRMSAKAKRLSLFFEELISECEIEIDEWVERKPELIIELINKLGPHIMLSKYLYLKIMDFVIEEDFSNIKKYSHRLNNNLFSSYLKSCSLKPETFIDFRNLEWDHVGFGTHEAATPYFSAQEIASEAIDIR